MCRATGDVGVAWARAGAAVGTNEKFINQRGGLAERQEPGAVSPPVGRAAGTRSLSPRKLRSKHAVVQHELM